MKRTRFSRLRPRCLVVLLALAAFSVASASAAILYTVTDLGVQGEATGINHNGWIVGVSSYGLESSSAFLYSNGVVHSIYTSIFGGTAKSTAFGINNAGQIVGQLSFSLGQYGGIGQAFLFANGQMQGGLGSLGNLQSAALAINDSGAVVGEASGSNFSGQHAFLSTNGVMFDIGSLITNEESEATGINNSGQIVGDFYEGGGGMHHAFLFSNGTITTLGKVGNLTLSYANGVNDDGVIVGGASTNNGLFNAIEAFAGEAGTIAGLGPPAPKSTGEQQATAINNSGQIVGYTSVGGLGGTHAFVYLGGAMADLNTLIDPKSGWVLWRANAINDHGFIVGMGVNARGATNAFLLTPAPPPLVISESAGGLTLSWPTNTAVGFSLYQTSDLTAPDWAPAGGIQSTVNNQYQTVISPLPGGSQFFRLQSN